jgi:hypothetical protein
MFKIRFNKNIMKKVITVALPMLFVAPISAQIHSETITVTTVTHGGKDDGTDDPVYITILGSLNDSEETQLNNSGINDLEPGANDTFTITSIDPLGDMLGIQLRIKGTDKWYMKSIKVIRQQPHLDRLDFENVSLDNNKTYESPLNTLHTAIVWDNCSHEGYSGSYVNPISLGQKNIGDTITFETTNQSTYKLSTIDTKSLETTSKTKVSVEASASGSYGMASVSVSVSGSKMKALATATSNSIEYTDEQVKTNSETNDITIQEKGDYYKVYVNQYRSGKIQVGSINPQFLEFSSMGQGETQVWSATEKGENFKLSMDNRDKIQAMNAGCQRTGFCCRQQKMLLICKIT